MENLHTLFGGDGSPEAYAACFAFAEFFHLFRAFVVGNSKSGKRGRK